MSTGSGGGFDLDHLLEQELQKNVGGLVGPSPSPAQSAYHLFAIGGKSVSLLSSITAVASTKAAAGLATAALVVGGGSVAASAATGSTSPGVWGKTVTAAVATCKGDLKPGEHGIGPCVSAVAKQKGVQERDAHSASAARENKPNGKGAGTHGGPPSRVPAGPPSSVPQTSDDSHPNGAPVTPPAHR
jgi:hypothetical protein